MAGSRKISTKALLSGAITVAILAIVLVVLAAVSPILMNKNASTTPQPAVVQPTPQAAALYQQALQAQQSGDTTRAAELARQAVAADPSNAAAKSLLDSIARSQSSASTPATSTATSTTPPGAATPNPATDPVFLKEYKKLSRLLPTSFARFNIGTPAEVKGDVSLSGSPTGGGETVSALVWEIHDAKSYAAAERYVTKTSKKAFAKNAASVTVDGVPAYFGTDGTQFATISFARGRYVFEVLATADKVTPVHTKAISLSAARAFPETPAP